MEYPRMLFKNPDTAEESTCVVQNADEKAAMLADGWLMRVLPGESIGPHHIGGEAPRGRRKAKDAPTDEAGG